MPMTQAERIAAMNAGRAAKKAAAQAQVDQVDKAATAKVEEVVGAQVTAAARADVLLSEDDIAAIKREAENIFFEERRKKARQMAIKGELASLRRAHGDAQVFGNHMDDIMSIMGDLPLNSDAIIINQRRIENGKMFTGPRHVCASILETMWNGQKAEHNLSGKTRDEFYRAQHPVVMTKQGSFVDQTETVRIG